MVCKWLLQPRTARVGKFIVAKGNAGKSPGSGHVAMLRKSAWRSMSIHAKAERIVGFILKCVFVIALVYFAVNRDSLKELLAPTHMEATASGEHRGAGAKLDSLTSLQRAASAKLMGAAREHCCTRPDDCLALLKAATAETAKNEHRER
jgi:hypothetical protein